MKRSIIESMIYGYMLNEGVFDRIKYINNTPKEIEKKLMYLKSHKDQITQDKLDEIRKEIDDYKNNVGEKFRKVYDKLYSILFELQDYLNIKERRESYKRGKEETNKFLAKFKDAPEWIYNNQESQDKVIKYINTKVIPTMMSPQFKKMLREVIDKDIASSNGYLDEEYDKEYFTNKNKIPVVKASDFEPGIIEIIQDETQQMRVLVRPYITEPIADIFGANTGDGDEGCIYI